MNEIEIFNYLTDRYVNIAACIREARNNKDKTKEQVNCGAKAAVSWILSDCFGVNIRRNCERTVTFSNMEISVTKDIPEIAEY